MYAGGGIGGPRHPVPKVPIVYQVPPWVQMSTPAPPSSVEKGPVEWTVPEKVTLGNTHLHTRLVTVRPPFKLLEPQF